ncbi:MAG TPA: ribonuclease III domain-containing protein [Syntrophomonadaceae bacterium]|nr:ribonuclease III domain-containing protein [Syntrophomonadaceae bacterium]
MLKHDTVDENILREYSATVLAYIGDAVFELVVRNHVVAKGNRKVKDIHLATVAMVKAESQAQIIKEIFGELTDDEQSVVMRGRNSKSTPPKHTDPKDYAMSTGFEALIGYLYLKGDEARIEELISRFF